MPQVFNLPRETARHLSSDDLIEHVAWISIGEPDIESSKISNEYLDQCPNLHLQFWDVEYPKKDGDKEYLPPTEEHAKQIVDFILLHRNKDLVVNCKMGVSRSGAIAAFCSIMLNYKWDLHNQERSGFGKRINTTLYKLMARYYMEVISNNLHVEVQIPSTFPIDHWLNDEEYAWFKSGYEYATTQTRAIPGLSKLTPSELYYVVTAIQRGASMHGENSLDKIESRIII